MRARPPPGLLRLVSSVKHPNRLVVDLGCGGVWAGLLLRAGFKVLGVDLSAPMLQLARQRAPAAAFHKGSLLRAALPECRAVTSLGECLSDCFDGARGNVRLARLFKRINQVLVPGGVLVFDVVAPGRVPGGAAKRLIADGKQGWAVLVDSREHRARRLLTRDIMTFRQVGRLYRADREVHRQRLFAPDDLLRLLRRAGSRARILAAHGRMRLAPGQVGFLAVKPRRSPGS